MTAHKYIRCTPGRNRPVENARLNPQRRTATRQPLRMTTSTIRRSHAARAMTLLETMLAMSLLTMIALLGAQGLRTTWQAWDMQDNRSTKYQFLEGTLAHITKHLRSARDIVAISAATDTSGSLTIALPDATVVTWDHDAALHRVRYGATPPGDLLANDIDTLKFEGFEIDGITPTVVPADIRMIRTTASFTVPVQNVPFSLSTDVWIRKQRDGLAAPFIDFDATSASGIGGWGAAASVTGPADNIFGWGSQYSSVAASNFDTSAQVQTDPVGTVLVGFLLKTNASTLYDAVTVQANVNGTIGPAHSFDSSSLIRFVNNPDWFWVDITDDHSIWTYADVSQTVVTFTNQGEVWWASTTYVDSIKIRTFTSGPNVETYWMSAAGPGQQEWFAPSAALGAPNGSYAHSQIFDSWAWDIDRQGYSFTSSPEDLGTIARVRLNVRYYLSWPMFDDMFHARLPLVSDPGEVTNTDAPTTATTARNAVLNQHVGSGNPGTLYLDLTNNELWTWVDLRSRFVRLYMDSIGSPDAEIFVDAVAVEVRYVPPNQAAVVLWEEL